MKTNIAFGYYHDVGFGVVKPSPPTPILDIPLDSSLIPSRGSVVSIFSRSTIGTYIDPDGAMQTASIDEARFEADGVLIEDTSTNLCSKSEAADLWTILDAVVAANQEISPDGTLTSDLVELAPGNGS